MSSVDLVAKKEQLLKAAVIIQNGEAQRLKPEQIAIAVEVVASNPTISVESALIIAVRVEVNPFIPTV